MTKQEIYNFFEYMTEKTNTKINGIESIPIVYWGETYVTGFKVDDSQNIMVQFKVVKRIDLTTLEENRTDYYMMNPDADFWLPYEFVDEATINEVFKEMTDTINAFNNFTVLHAEYTDKNTEQRISDGIIFSSKRLACKEGMNYKRNYKDTNVKFIEVGEKPKREKTISVFEFATSALE